jgi:hypothetical protein
MVRQDKKFAPVDLDKVKWLRPAVSEGFGKTLG